MIKKIIGLILGRSGNYLWKMSWSWKLPNFCKNAKIKTRYAQRRKGEKND
ncbi:MAG: hypothetical protein NTW04_02930 [Elusimicrobia bacterium]|nr:hypothetical protein [Elusimicrobiota bacterium]